VARSGVMTASADNQYLRFILRDGYSYSEQTTGENHVKRPLTTIGFDEQVLTFDISSFSFNRSSEDLFKGSYQMMNIAQLDTTVRKLEKSLQTRREQGSQQMLIPFHAWQHWVAHDTVVPTENDVFGADRRRTAVSFALNTARSTAKDAKMQADLQQADSEYINRHRIEWQRKYTLSVACLLMFLIGAPFGSIVRKGGLGLPLVASVLFFVIYYVIGMIAEKAVRESAIGPIGMWISTLDMLPIGLVLTFQATTDSSLFDGGVWRQRLQRLFHRKATTKDDTIDQQ
jgi:lipopolysaccharide export system permease protein